MSNFLYHNKYHRANHHTLPNSLYPDSATDPIASATNPFLGIFYTALSGIELDTIPVDVRYIVTFIDDSITTFQGLSVNTLDSVFYTITVNAEANSFEWYRAYTNIFTLSNDYSLYPGVTGVLTSLSGIWNLGASFGSSFKNNSARYTSVYNNVYQNSGTWPFIDTTLRLNLVQQNTRSKNFSMKNITTTNTDIFWNLSAQQVAYFSLTSNSTLKNINTGNMKKGGEYFLIIQQDGYGQRVLTFESDYKLLASEIVSQITPELVNFSTNEIWTSVYYGNDSWIAVPYNSYKASRSDDGVSWYGVPLPDIRKWTSIVFGNSAWITVAHSLGSAARSTDNGLTWTYENFDITRQWSCVSYGNKTFVVVASASNIGVRSTDYGLTWTQFTLPFTGDWASVKYADNTWVAVAGGGFDGKNAYDLGAVSYDNGLNWQSFQLPASRLWSDVAYGEDYWVAVAKNSQYIALSSRLEGGGNWFDLLVTNASVSGFSSIAYGNDLFVAAGLEPSKCIFSSVDGKIWLDRVTIPKKIYNVNYGGTSLGGNFYLVGKDNDDTVTYTNYRAMAFDGPDTSTVTGILTAPLGVTVIKFICDGINMYGIPSVYYVSRGPVWTYFAGDGISFNPNPTDLFAGEGLIPLLGLTTAGSVVVDEGFSSPDSTVLFLSTIPIP